MHIQTSPTYSKYNTNSTTSSSTPQQRYHCKSSNSSNNKQHVQWGAAQRATVTVTYENRRGGLSKAALHVTEYTIPNVLC